MSKDLLRQVGEFLYGNEWQAPLARDISVGERSVRRWAAGTDEIPAGVWRDIGFRLESLQGDLEYLIGEVRGPLSCAAMEEKLTQACMRQSPVVRRARQSPVVRRPWSWHAQAAWAYSCVPMEG